MVKLKDYYDQKRGKGKPRNTVLRALAFKRIRILFRCWKDRKPYCEEIYRQALHRRKQLAAKTSPVQLPYGPKTLSQHELVAYAARE